MRWLSLLLLLVACAGDGTEGTDPPGDPLSDPAYRFCHETDPPVALTPYERSAYCPIAEDASDCPGLVAACEGSPDTDAGTEAAAGCGGGRSGSSGPSAPDAPPPPPAEAPDLTAPEVIGEVLRWTVAFAVALLVAGLLFAAVRALLGWLGRARDGEVPEATAEPVSVQSVAVPDADEVPDAPPADLLAAARAALDEGRFDEVVLLCRGASLRALGDAGLLRIHPSRTDREYVRALRRSDTERHAALRTVMRVVEGLRWGGRGISAQQARDVLTATGRIVTLIALFLMLAATPEALAAPGRDYAPSGSAVLEPLLEQHGFEVRWRLRGLQSVDDDTSVLLVDATVLTLSPLDQRALRDWVEAGGVLILAGEANVGFSELGFVVPAPPAARVEVSRSARDIGLAAPVRLGGLGYAYAGEEGTPLVLLSAPEDPATLVQAVSIGQGAVIGVADARYLTNGALAVRDNADFLAGLPFVGEALGLYGLPDPLTVELATVAGAAGDAGDSPLGALANARLLPLVLQILLVVALVGLWRGWPFGPPRDPPTEGRVAFADHARALGRRFARARASRHVAGAQASLVLARQGPVALQAAAERQGYAPAEARAFVERVQALADDPDGPDAASDLNLVEELWRITRA